jgi:hypothetical protein
VNTRLRAIWKTELPSAEDEEYEATILMMYAVLLYTTLQLVASVASAISAQFAELASTSEEFLAFALAPLQITRLRCRRCHAPRIPPAYRGSSPAYHGATTRIPPFQDRQLSACRPHDSTMICHSIWLGSWRSSSETSFDTKPSVPLLGLFQASATGKRPPSFLR